MKNEYVNLEEDLASNDLSKKQWNKLIKIIDSTFKNKCTINMNEEKEGEFDILEIFHLKATKNTTAKQNSWLLITARKGKLSYIFCSIYFWKHLKVIGKAKHKLITTK
jgi:hypothetical protein